MLKTVVRNIIHYYNITIQNVYKAPSSILFYLSIFRPLKYLVTNNIVMITIIKTYLSITRKT